MQQQKYRLGTTEHNGNIEFPLQKTSATFLEDNVDDLPIR